MQVSTGSDNAKRQVPAQRQTNSHCQMFAKITSEHHTEGQLAFIGRDWLTVRALDSATGVGALDLSVIVLKPHGALILIQGYMTDMRVSASALLLLYDH